MISNKDDLVLTLTLLWEKKPKKIITGSSIISCGVVFTDTIVGKNDNDKLSPVINN